MNWDLFVPLLVTTLIAIGGWLVAHSLTARRDRANRRRDMRIQFLIEAYRKLEHAGNRRLDTTTSPGIESAVADIQLFGSPTQVALAQQFADQLAETKSVSYSSLLENLRADLRKELGLEEVPSGLKHLRISERQDDPS